ncbi:MAG: YeeE/YedE family protein [Chitinophagaceae bacterium]|nr:YeeE/YedE family protein [Chitinophagaceae bacterium]
MIEWLRQPWPWYVSGPLIGLMVPLLLILGNRSFGVSSSLRHICAACMPSRIPFFTYEWKKEMWNLFFVFGIFLGGLVVYLFMSNPNTITVDPRLVNELQQYGISDFTGLVPNDIFNWQSLFTFKGIIMMVGGGLLVGFGTRYAGGCTSGHAVMGISTLQWPSVIATICFMAGGFLVANFVLPAILKL